MLRKIIRADGSEELLPTALPMDEIRQRIDAKGVDFVSLIQWGTPLWVLICDDNGYETECIDHGGGRFEMKPVRPLKPVNEKATALYWERCITGTSHQIVGDVCIVPDGDFA